MAYLKEKFLGINGQAIVFLILIAVFILSRLLMIDTDLPFYNISGYSPFDELFYTQVAFDLVYGVHAPNAELLGPEGAYFNALHPYITAISLFLFGNNYTGLRLPSVIFGVLIITIFFYLIRQRFGFYVAIVATIALIVDPGFVNATYAAETTISRLATALAMVFWSYLLLQQQTNGVQISRKQLAFYGAGAICAFVFVYPTNMFVCAACGLVATLLLGPITFREMLNRALSFSLGAVLAVGFYLVFLFLVLDFPINQFTYVFDIFGGRIVDKESSIFIEIRKNLSMISRARFFIENTYFTVLTQIAVLIIALKIVYDLIALKIKWLKPVQWMTQLDWVVLIFVTIFALQTALFHEGAPKRKMILLLPFVLYLCVLAFEILRKEFFIYRVKCNNIAVIFLLLPFIYFSFLSSFSESKDSFKYNFKNAMKSLQEYGDIRTIGAMSISMRLYNDTRPFLNPYTYQYDKDRMKNIYWPSFEKLSQSEYVKYSLAYEAETTNLNMDFYNFSFVKTILVTDDPRYIYNVGLYKYCPDQKCDLDAP